MIRINVAEAKARLSHYLSEAERGEVVVLCRRNVPVAELRAVSKQLGAPRPIGLDDGLFEVPDSFFEDLPEELLAAFQAT